MQETQFQSLGQEGPLEKEVATHFRILAWEIPWTEETGRLQFMGSQRVGYGLVTNNNNKNNKSACQVWVVQILPTNSVFLLLVFVVFFFFLLVHEVGYGKQLCTYTAIWLSFFSIPRAFYSF